MSRSASDSDKGDRSKLKCRRLKSRTSVFTNRQQKLAYILATCSRIIYLASPYALCSRPKHDLLGSNSTLSSYGIFEPPILFDTIWLLVGSKALKDLVFALPNMILASILWSCPSFNNRTSKLSSSPLHRPRAE